MQAYERIVEKLKSKAPDAYHLYKHILPDDPVEHQNVVKVVNELYNNVLNGKVKQIEDILEDITWRIKKNLNYLNKKLKDIEGSILKRETHRVVKAVVYFDLLKEAEIKLFGYFWLVDQFFILMVEDFLYQELRNIFGKKYLEHLTWIEYLTEPSFVYPKSNNFMKKFYEKRREAEERLNELKNKLPKETYNSLLRIIDLYKISKKWLDKAEEFLRENRGILEVINYLQGKVLENLKPEDVVFSSDEDFITPYFITKMENFFRKITLRGTSASLGIAKGKAKVAESPDDLKTEKKFKKFILIVENTDPSYTPYLSNCLGIIAEEGGILCHAAIVARELGIPCVVGVKEARKRIKDKEEIFMDADLGIIVILDRLGRKMKV